MTDTSETSRIAHLRTSDMSPAQLDLYRSITTGPRTSGPQLFALVDDEGGLLGPFEAMLRSPGLGEALQGVGAAVRYHTALSARTREMAILAVASAWGSSFESYAHEAVGRHVGLSEAEIDTLRSGSVPQGTGPEEGAILRATEALVKGGDLNDEEYAELVDQIGEAGVFELTTLVGYYSLLALQLRVFRVEAPSQDD